MCVCRWDSNKPQMTSLSSYTVYSGRSQMCKEPCTSKSCESWSKDSRGKHLSSKSSGHVGCYIQQKITAHVCFHQGHGAWRHSPAFPEQHSILIAVVHFWWAHCHLSKIRHVKLGANNMATQPRFIPKHPLHYDWIISSSNKLKFSRHACLGRWPFQHSWAD